MKPIDFLKGHNFKNEYRIGDAVLHRNDAEAVVICEPMQTLFFKDTILNKYLWECRKEGKNIDIDKLRRITLELGKEKDWEKPKKNECVIHLRIGDTKRITASEVSTIINRLKYIKPKSVTFVSFYHHPARVSEEEKIRTLEENDQTIHQLEGACNELGIKVNWRSCLNPDEDFYYLINADTLLCTNGGFSIVSALANPKFNSDNFVGRKSDREAYDFYAKGADELLCTITA